MSAKLLQALGDENPDLKKQIGCMTGIFQLFDRHHILPGKRGNSHANKRLVQGHPNFNENSNGVEPASYSPRTISEKNLSKNVNENQRNSNESSKDSFSSSPCSSSVSSLNCGKAAQSEPPSSEQTALLDKSPRNPPKLKNPDIDSRNNNYALCQEQPKTYSPRHQESLDLRGVVKDFIYRETRALPIKTMPRVDPVNHVLKHRDTPRPLQLSKSVDEARAVGSNGKPKLPSDFHESLRVLEKLKEAPRYFSEVRESPRSSCRTKVSKDAPRFSYDGREIPRPSFDSKEIGRSTIKLKELPRLSLDSREGSMGSYFKSKSGKSSSITCLNPEEELGSNKRSPSIVEKLMGLEVMPNSREDNNIFNGEKNASQFSKISKATKEGKQDRNTRSPKNSFKAPVSPQRRNPDLVMKPISSSRFPIETAPWRQPVRSHSPKKTALINRDARARPQTSPSVYTEIKKRLKDLEFQQSGKDLSALKHMVDAMPAKWPIEKKNEEGQASRFLNRDSPNPVWLDQNPKLANNSNMPNSQLVLSSKRTHNTPSSSVSPIVIMTPAKFINRSNIPTSSVIPPDEFSGLPRIWTGDLVGSKSVLVKTRTEKELTPKLSLKEPVTSNFGSMDKKTNAKSMDNNSQKPRTQLTQISSRPQPLTRENTGGSSTKNSGSLSPRLQQRKVDQENRSRSAIPSAELSKPRRKPLRQQSESGSPGGRHRPKPPYALQNDDQSSEISSETRMSSHHDDEISVRSDSNNSMASQVDIEVRSADRPRDVNTQLSNQRPSQRADSNMASNINQKKSLPSFSKDGLSVVEVTAAAPEQPSPVSVLDASFYKEDLLPSPVKKMDNPFIDDDTWNANAIFGEEGRNLMDLNCLSPSRHPDTTSKINDKKLEKIECLVQKLRCFNSAHDENSTDNIASLCENMNPNHRYISEVLLASGLLLKDFSSGRPQIQTHSSGQLINPNLFLVLEKTKVSWISTTDPGHESTILCSKADKEKLHRKLLFDTVNEILIQKFALIDPQHEPWLQLSKPAGGQQLLEELCSEIDRLKPHSLEVFLDDNDDELKSALREDMMRRTESWNDFRKEVSGLVLDIERLIFKDLVAEIVSSKSSSLRAKQSRRRRQLFAK